MSSPLPRCRSLPPFRPRWHDALLVALCAFALPFAPGALASEAVDRAPRARVDVQVDPRVELLSVIFRLAGHPEYNRARVDAYAADVDAHFGEHRNHPVVALARTLRQSHGIGYDAVMSLAVHLTPPPAVKMLVPLEPRPTSLENRWTVEDARRFAGLAREFAKETSFGEFFSEHQKLYATTVARMEKVIEQARLNWFDEFFGERPGARFTVALGLLNGGNCYGVHVQRSPKRDDLYCVLGVWSTDGQGLPRFETSMLGTVAHEFAHSYVNPLVEARASEFEKAGTTLFSIVEAPMRRQAYGNWKTVMCESLVRASVVHYVRETQGEKAAEKEIRENIGNAFRWTRELSELLDVYQKSREEYRTLEEFVPRVVAFFDDYAPRLAREVAEQRARAPKIVSITPAIGDASVRPGESTITVVFDRPMKPGSYAFVGGGPRFPELKGKASYDAARKVITLPVLLKPNWSYEFWLNSERHKGFFSEDGVPLEPVHVTFHTSEGD